MKIRSLLPALVLVLGTACSDGADRAENAADTARQDDTSAANEPVEEETEPAEPASTREVLSGDVSSIALDTNPPIADMMGDDGRPMALEIPVENIEAVLDAWGGVATPLTLDCERGEPFTAEDGTTFEYYKDCRLP